MDIITAEEAARMWGITPRRVQILCAGGRIPNAKKMGGIWLIPAGATKPADPRKKISRGANDENSD